MKSFSKKYKIAAKASEVFIALTNPKAIESWSGASAIMNAKAGFLFSLWDGEIQGKNVSVTKEQITQEWKEAKWLEYSQVTFKIKEIKGITKVELIHNGIPEASFESIKDGWDRYYMIPLTQYVEENREY